MKGLDEAKKKKLAYVMMCLLVVAWGFDFIVVKKALTVFEPLGLMFFKYLTGFIFVFILKLKLEPHSHFHKKDLPLLIACCLFGEILYFYSEYTAFDYLPVSIVSVFLAFVPMVSIIIEWIAFKRRPGLKIVVGMIVGILGIALIIGVDIDTIMKGQWIGYMLVFFAILSWNAYNFITASLNNKYSELTLTVNQLFLTSILMLPLVIGKLPPASEIFTVPMVSSILYIGVICGGIGFLIVVFSLGAIGPTRTAMFSNFMTVVVAIFGWWILGETLSQTQIIGGIIVMISGYIVIKEKGKLEDVYTG